MVIRNVLTTIMELKVSERVFATWYNIKYSHTKMPKEIRVGGYFIIVIHYFLFIFWKYQVQKNTSKGLRQNL